MTDVLDTAVSEVEGVLAGPVRRSVNAAQDSRGSIHDDETAGRLGFRGGTVAGSVHLDLFPPVLVAAFGTRWFERGSLSVNFKSPTVDREPVQAFVRRPAEGAVDAQVEAWIDREDGMRVGEGTASVGEPAEPSALRSLDLNRYAGGEYRILGGVSAGDEIPARTVVLAPERQRALLDRDLVTEPLSWYRGDSPWGGAIVLPQQMVHVLYQPGAAFLGRSVQEAGGGVGLFGAIELENLGGPLLLGREYEMAGRVLALGQSPKTEYAWFEVTASEPAGAPVARLLMQLRFMKASSPRYADA